jgi:hypothetical protein
MTTQFCQHAFKHPKTPHLPWSESISSDDNWLTNCDHFKDKEVVVTLKCDGECTSMYRDHIHARSVYAGEGVGRSWVKQLHGNIKHDIPEQWRITGENLYAAHSIWYWDLETYFYVFAIFDENNQCLNWDDTKSITTLLGLKTVPEIYRGVYDEKAIRSAWAGLKIFDCFETPEDHVFTPNPVPTTEEGYVIRTIESFPYHLFHQHYAKMVREGHVKTTSHWSKLPLLPNRIQDEDS